MGGRDVSEVQAGELLERWRAEWQLLQEDVQSIMIARQLFWDLHEELLSHTYSGQLLVRYLIVTYSDSQAIAARRLVDGDGDSRSLTNVLDEMAQRSELLSRAEFVSRADGKADGLDELLDREFSRFAGKTPDFVPEEVIRVVQEN